MDEPTASLTPREVERLFAIVRRVRDEGVAIAFISHRLPEVFEISDRITVLRDGDFIGTRSVGDTTPEEVIKMMVGRELGEGTRRDGGAPGEPLLEVTGLSRRASSTTSVSPCGPARSSAWRASSARAAPRSPAPSSASRGPTPVR